MAKLTKESIKQLSELCRIHCTDEEQESLYKDLENILEYFNLLQEIDTQDVAPCHRVLEDTENRTRPDEVKKTMPRDVFLANAPSHTGGFIKVPTVIKKN